MNNIGWAIDRMSEGTRVRRVAWPPTLCVDLAQQGEDPPASALVFWDAVASDTFQPSTDDIFAQDWDIA